MRTQDFDQWFKISKNMTTPFHEWSKACMEMGKRLTQQQLDMLSENVSRLSDQFNRLSRIRRPEEWIDLQKDCLHENINASMETVQKLIQLSVENVTQFTNLCGTLHEQTIKTAEKEKTSKSSS